MKLKNRTALIVLDGFGIGKDSPFNAIQNARMPFYQKLLKQYPHSELLTHGEAVGLPKGIMGNSEVGHMTMGAGRIIYQDLVRLNHMIAKKDFFKHPGLLKALNDTSKKGGRIHFMGLCSDGGVHSHLDHLDALLTLAMQLKLPRVSVHAFTDGRDTPPDSAPGFIKHILKHKIFSSKQTECSLASIMGRYFAMDRDQRWERVEKAYRTLTGQIAAQPGLSALDAIEKSYANGKSDEFIEPILLDQNGAIRDGDMVLFFNYRSDRAREITLALTGEHAFSGAVKVKPLHYLCMTQYDPNFKYPVILESQSKANIFGEWLERHDLSQFRIAETEKYAHVTFFFNGGREKPFKKEERVMVPSPKDVATYDLKPEMSAREVSEEVVKRIDKQAHDFFLMNFANGDMVGHTGNYDATVKAMECLDQCLEKVIGSFERNGYHTLLTADHGNAEEMCDKKGRPHTQHTLNPVPAIWIQPGSAQDSKLQRKHLKEGTLADLMPTLCHLMGLKLPKEVTGKCLIPTPTASKKSKKPVLKKKRKK